MPFSFFPQRVYQTTSKLSGEIVVKKQFGKCKLYVQGVLQSGGIVKDIWAKALKRIMNDELRIMNVLILGLGGGTVVGLVKKHWPEAKITGIEIDPEIIKIGKKYFSLDKIKKLEIIQVNAFAWIKTYSNDTYHWSKSGKRRKNLDLFDLIIVDLYLGKKFPKKAESKKFLKNIKKLLAKDGIAIFNRLRVKETNLVEFEKKPAESFSAVEKVKTPTNLFFLARS